MSVLQSIEPLAPDASSIVWPDWLNGDAGRPEIHKPHNEIDDLDRLLDASFKFADGILYWLDKILPPAASN
jgi:hypothetical protein